MKVVLIDKEEAPPTAKDSAISNLVNMLKLPDSSVAAAATATTSTGPSPIASFLAQQVQFPPGRSFLPPAASVPGPVRVEPQRQEQRPGLGRNMCSFFNNGKGRCFFGKSCKFSHEIIP